MHTSLLRHVCCLVAFLGLGGNFVGAIFVGDAGQTDATPSGHQCHFPASGISECSFSAVYPRIVDQLCVDLVTETVEEGESHDGDTAFAKTSYTSAADVNSAPTALEYLPSFQHRTVALWPADERAQRPRYLLHRALLI